MGIFGNKDDLKKKSKTEVKQVEEEPEEEEESEDTYSYDYDCDNCGETVTWDIPMGKRVIDYEPTDKCENCGCEIVDPEDRGDSQEKKDD